MNHPIKIAVTGASGMLGTAILDHLMEEYDIFATSRSIGYKTEKINWQIFDLLDNEKLVNWLKNKRPEVVIHCAAIVDVDQCEKEPVKARNLHVNTTKTIADVISQWRGRLIYISTDSVFDGCQQVLYEEEAKPNPKNTYALTKYEGELETLASPGGIVLRTNIFGWSQKEHLSFAEWILKGLLEKTPMTMFTDVNFTPLHVSHVAQIILQIIKTDISGLFHLAGSAKLSKYDFTFKLAKEFGLNTDKVVPVSIDEVNLAAGRPKNIALSNAKLSKLLGYCFPSVDEGIAYLKIQYHNGWLAKIKNRTLAPGYFFWRII